MIDGLDLIIIDDEKEVCDVIKETIGTFYTWGDILIFTSIDEAFEYCMDCDTGIKIFILDVFVDQRNGFSFLDDIAEKYPSAKMDTIMISGNADADVVNMCVASGVNYLLEKPVKPYALQLAVRSILAKYLDFAKRLLNDPSLAESISRI
ncbi:MAG: response regulator [Thermodesulfobacteriota bacterium]|nr:response regulator [Thermodesulfobacteriota bacterium]